MDTTRRALFPLFGGMLLAAIGLVGACSMARAHDAPSGFRYDQNCCSDGDCAPALKVVYDEKTDLYTVTTKHGTATEDPRVTKRLTSPDGNIHACIMSACDEFGGGNCYYWMRCLYLIGSV